MNRTEILVFDGSYYWVSAATFVGTIFSYFCISPAFSYSFIPSYRRFKEDKRVTWNSYTVSSVFGAISSLLCIYAVLFEDNLREDILWYDSKHVRSTCAFVCGYMLAGMLAFMFGFDCFQEEIVGPLACCDNYRQYGEIGYLAHHSVSIYSYNLIMGYGVLAYFGNFRLLAEISTPFVNMRWLLDALGYSKSSKPYMYNGVLMTLVFYGCRVFVMPYFWTVVYIEWGTRNMYRVAHLVYAMVVACVVLDTLNIYWAYKMYIGVRKVLSLNSKKEE